MNIYSEIQDLKLNLSASSLTPQEKNLIEEEYVRTKNKIGLLSSNTEEFQQTVLQEISRLSKEHNISISSFTEPELFNVEDKEVELYSYSIYGSYDDLIKVIHSIEGNPRIQKFISVEMYLHTDRRSKKEYLFADLKIQRVRL